MSAELKDFRGRITAETNAVLEAESQSTGKDKQEIVRDILHVWALERIHGATVLHNLLRSEGLKGIVGGVGGNTRESEGTRGSLRDPEGTRGSGAR